MSHLDKSGKYESWPPPHLGSSTYPHMRCYHANRGRAAHEKNTRNVPVLLLQSNVAHELMARGGTQHAALAVPCAHPWIVLAIIQRSH